MLAIKFKRVGKKHQASFRIVVTERRSKLRGRFIEDLGWYDPHAHKSNIEKERTLYWMGVGAKPTSSVHNLLVKDGITKGKKIPVHGKAKAPAAGEEGKTEVVPQKTETKTKNEAAPAS